MDDRADKINVEDGIDIDKMKDNGHAKEAKPPKSCHYDLVNEYIRICQKRWPYGKRPTGGMAIRNALCSCQFPKSYTLAREIKGRLADICSTKPWHCRRQAPSYYVLTERLHDSKWILDI